MPDHIKPTIKELEDNINKSKEEIEKIDNASANTSDKKEEADQKSSTDQKKESNQSKTNQEDKDKQEDKQAENIETDYKKKFTESSREVQILRAKDKKINEAIEKATLLEDHEEDIIKKSYPDWDVMSETEKIFAKDNYKFRKALDSLSAITKESKDIHSWNKKVDEYIEDPKTLIDNPQLEGRQEEFKHFATKPTRRGVDFETLKSAFLFEVNEKKTNHKGSMFPTGSAGTNEKSSKDKLSVMEGRQLMKVDYKTYIKYLKEGKISNE